MLCGVHHKVALLDLEAKKAVASTKTGHGGRKLFGNMMGDAVRLIDTQTNVKTAEITLADMRGLFKTPEIARAPGFQGPEAIAFDRPR